MLRLLQMAHQTSRLHRLLTLLDSILASVQITEVSEEIMGDFQH